MDEIGRFKIKIKGIKKLIIETKEHDISKLISDLKFERGLITKEIKDVQAKLKKLKISKNILIQLTDHFLQM